MKRVLKITGLDCAVCAGELERLVSKIEGVQEASVAFAQSTVTVLYDSEETLQKVKAAVNAFEEVRIVEEDGAPTVLQIENLHCASCAAELEERLKALKGVQEARVDFITQKIFLTADASGVSRAIKCANRFEKVRVVGGGETVRKKEKNGREWLRILLSAVFLGSGVVCGTMDGVFSVLGYVFYAAAYLVVGYDILLLTFKNILKGRIFDENFLMTVASVGAAFLGEYAEGVAVMLLYQLGELLQRIAVGASRNSVARLMDLKTTTATRIKENGEYETVPPERLEVGDTVLIKAGEKVPCDGMVTDGTALLDTKSLTGEAEPKNFEKGQEVLSGFVNAGGVFTLQIIRKYEDSAVKKILDLMENSSAKKAVPEKFITKFARYYTPAVCIFAVLFATVPPLISYFAVGSADLRRWVQSALTFLVVSCPCALIISVPLTYFSGMGHCARKGVLVKGATYLDEAARVKTIAFDKTGTLTEGNFSVLEVLPTGCCTSEELLSIATALEQNSSHPIAKAFICQTTDKKALGVVESTGKGVCGTVDGKTVLIGSLSYLQDNGITAEKILSPYTILYIARENDYLGAVLIGDNLRLDCKSTVEALQKSGYRTVMLTGDTLLRAKSVAEEVGIEEYKAELLPADKLAEAEKLKENGKLMYLGDGINDAPVMAAADIAVSMGKLGSAAAVEASDLVLVSDTLSALPALFQISKKTGRIVKENIVFSIVMKTVFMLLGAFGLLPLSLAVFADVGVMILAVLNSLRVNA